jgi:hypothetical protein
MSGVKFILVPYIFLWAKTKDVEHVNMSIETYFTYRYAESLKFFNSSKIVYRGDQAR